MADARRVGAMLAVVGGIAVGVVHGQMDTERGGADVLSRLPVMEPRLDLPTELARVYHRLVRREASVAERDAAAVELLQAAGTQPRAVDALETAMASEQPRAVRGAVLQAIAVASGDVPETLGVPLLELTAQPLGPLQPLWGAALARLETEAVQSRLLEWANNSAAEEDAAARGRRLAAIAALGHRRDQAVVRVLMTLTEEDQPEAVRAASFDALDTLTGLDLGDDRQRWVEWYRDHGRLSASRWERHLRDNFVRRSLTQANDSQQLEDRLLEAQRALYRTASPGDRPAVLVYMLDDPLEPIRQLGLDLALRRLLDAQAFDEPLRAALRQRLSDESAEVRQRATLLLRDLLDGPAAEAVAQRLATGEERVTPVLRAGPEDDGPAAARSGRAPGVRAARRRGPEGRRRRGAGGGARGGDARPPHRGASAGQGASGHRPDAGPPAAGGRAARPARRRRGLAADRWLAGPRGPAGAGGGGQGVGRVGSADAAAGAAGGGPGDRPDPHRRRDPPRR